MSRLLQALHSDRVLLMDGAMGTELLRAGLPADTCSGMSNLTHPEQVRAVHRTYVANGAEVLLTNTFQANAGIFFQQGHADQFVRVTEAAIQSARDAAGANRLVLLDVGPIPREGRNQSAITLLECARRYAVDGVLVETSSDVADVTAILLERSRQRMGKESLPVLMSWTFRRDSRGKPVSEGGFTPQECAALTSCFEIAALGVNCGQDIGIDEILEVLHSYRAATNLPLFARPNAGTPVHNADGWVYPLTPEQLAARLPELLAAGIAMFGGCCGTTPAHLAACRPIVDEWNRRHAPA